VQLWKVPFHFCKPYLYRQLFQATYSLLSKKDHIVFIIKNDVISLSITSRESTEFARAHIRVSLFNLLLVSDHVFPALTSVTFPDHHDIFTCNARGNNSTRSSRQELVSRPFHGLISLYPTHCGNWATLHAGKWFFAGGPDNSAVGCSSNKLTKKKERRGILVIRLTVNNKGLLIEHEVCTVKYQTKIV
jgi:hypothetical protein